MAKSAGKAGSGAEKANAAAAAKVKPAAPAKSATKRKRARKKVVVTKIVAQPEVALAARVEAPADAEPVIQIVETPDLETAAKSAEPINEQPDQAQQAEPVPTVTQLKEKIMANAKTTDFTKPIAEAITELQTKAKAAYEKGAAVTGEVTEFSKGNVEALVESGKALAAGMKDIGKTYVEEAKSAYETLTADLKEMAEIRSPVEMFQLQGKIARRNFEALIAQSSKTGDEVMKLYTDAFAPISSRVSLAAEKISKAA